MMATANPKKPDTFAAWRFKEFRLYFGSRFFFTLASQMQTTIVGFYIYQLTHSKVAIAFIGLSEVIPAIGIALYGGYIADKYEKRKMLLLIYSGVLFTSVVMFTFTLRSMSTFISIGQIPFIIYGMLFLNGIGRAFYEPASFAIYAGSIPREVYPNASNWNNLSWQSASIIGPLAGGFIYAFAGRVVPGLSGISATYGVIILLFLAALALVYKFSDCPPLVNEKEEMLKSISAGIRFVFNSRIMLYAMSLDLFSVFFGGVIALLPVYALDILKVGAEGLGIMRMAFSLGAMLTMLALTRFPPMAKPWRNLLIAVTGFGCSIVGFGLSNSYILSLMLLFMQGAFDSVSVMIRGTLMQLLTPEKMRGRVSAVNSMFISSSAEIGDFESGMAAKILGTIPAVIFGGCMTILVTIFTYFKTRELLSSSLSDIVDRAGQGGA